MDESRESCLAALLASVRQRAEPTGLWKAQSGKTNPNRTRPMVVRRMTPPHRQMRTISKEVNDEDDRHQQCVLRLLDEVLNYMERSAAARVKASMLQRQTKEFIQNLTVEVANSSYAVMDY